MKDTGNTPPYILVANDYSPEARASADAAFQIAQNKNLPIRGLYVIDEALMLDPYTNYHAELPLMSRASKGANREPASRAELIGCDRS